MMGSFACSNRSNSQSKSDKRIKSPKERKLRDENGLVMYATGTNLNIESGACLGEEAVQ